jgi:hypothetical protein
MSFMNVKTVTKEGMPYKLVLVDPYGKKHTFYKSTTEYLSYNKDYFKAVTVQEMPRQGRVDFTGGRTIFR